MSDCVHVVVENCIKADGVNVFNESSTVVIADVIVCVRYFVFVFAGPPEAAGIMRPRLTPTKMASITIKTVKVVDSALPNKVNFFK